MMDPAIGEPFLEHEKRLMLTEALRVSPVPVDKLLNLLQEGGGGSPDWDNMLLPRGRTLSQCRAAYEVLRSGPQPHLSPLVRPFPASIQPQPQSFQHVQQKRKSDSSIIGSPYMSGEPSAKRRQSGMESMAGARNIQPKPPNGGSPPGSTVSLLAAPPQKRRGRPPKQEVERRNRDAMQRGEVFPAQLPGMPPAGEFATSPYAPIAPTPSLAPGPPTPQASTEQNLPDDQADSPGKRKRPKATAKPPRVWVSDTAKNNADMLKALPLKQPGESSFSVNPQLPVVREPQVRQQVPSIATVAGIHAVPAPLPGTIASVMLNPPPATVEAVTSAELQPSAEAAT